MRTITITFLLNLILISTNASDSLFNQKPISKKSTKKDATIPILVNQKTGRVIYLNSGRHVRIYCIHKKSMDSKIKRAYITGYNDDKISFKPFSKRYDTISYAYDENINQSNLTYIEVTTTDSVIGGIIVNALIIAGITAVAITLTIILAVPAMLTGTDPSDWFPSIKSSGAKNSLFKKFRKQISLDENSQWKLVSPL